MRNLSCFLLDITMVIASIWILKKFLGTFFETKKLEMVTAAAWILFAVYQFFNEYHKGNASIWNMVLTVLLALLIAVVGYEKKGRLKILYLVLLYVVWCLTEMMVYFCFNSLGGNRESFSILGSVVSKILMMILVHVLSVCWKKRDINAIPPLYYYTLLFVPLGSIFIAVNAFYMTEYRYFSSMVTVCILFYINIIIFEICSKLSENFILENERTVCAQQIDIIAKSTEEQKKMMEEFYAKKHNLVNELAALMDSIEHSSREHVLERLRGIVKAYDIGERVSNCGNSTIDTLINFKYAAAKEMGISFKLKIFVPEHLPMNECDLGVVIGNALDNAIEATKNCLRHEKEIQIVMGVKKEAFVVIIKNPYEHRLKWDKTGELVSTKEESKGHGYGVRAIKHVVEKYYGEVLTEETPEQFILRAFMNIGEL